jgi:(p)ppGpp synthase/HD superfamily hydrolase
MDDLEKAIKIAFEAHLDQKDRSGEPYILHPLYVMGKMDTHESRIVAILHDVIEDTPWTLDKLRKEGFSEEIISAIDHITRRDGESYLDYIHRVATNPLARKVKLADLEHNMDLRRLKIVTPQDISRIEERYKPALELLKS